MSSIRFKSIPQDLFLQFISICSACLFFGIVLSGCNVHEQHKEQKMPVENPNSIIRFFEGAEIQAETDQQREQIKIVLNDMVTLPATELKMKRYPDYQGRPGQWDIIKFLHSYFVPASPMVLSPATFYEDLSKPGSHAFIQGHLDRISAYLEANKDPQKK